MPSKIANEYEDDHIFRGNWQALAFLAYEQWLKQGHQRHGCVRER